MYNKKEIGASTYSNITSVEFFVQVKLLRVHQRVGLIHARVVGAGVATGKIIVFLDSHCECGPSWLEPLVDAIDKDPKTVAIPVVDVINPDTLKYQHVKSVPIGGFSWQVDLVRKDYL